jgi:hypothetical protein
MTAVLCARTENIAYDMESAEINSCGSIFASRIPAGTSPGGCSGNRIYSGI